MSVAFKQKMLVAKGAGPNRANRNAQFELSRFSTPDIQRLLAQLEEQQRILGSREPCGPVFNLHRGIPLWMRGLVWSFVLVGSAGLLPFQLGASIVMLLKGRPGALWKELPGPNLEMTNWYFDMVSFIKAPIHLIKKSIDQEAALCVNRDGRFAIKESGYAVMSHVWGETMGWQTTEAWGPVDISLRKMGIARAHFLRFFDRCEAEWLWVDVIAMPEVLEDMSPDQKEETERLRVGVINCLHSIYTRADRVVMLDSLMLRLSSRSPVDAAIILCLGAWMSRLWTYTEARLARKIVLRTRDSVLDLDEIIRFLGKAVLNDDHRYYPLVQRLWPLRDVAITGLPFQQESLMGVAYRGGENRFTDVEVDAARALFPLFDMKWEHGWTLQQGLSHIAGEMPQDASWVEAWCRYRRIEWNAHESPAV